ncbi:MAG: hypothetical protein HY429_04245 [Candidatus Levybacteria bacterium]|nr:hypothetical protein [Candidatus Levybacteria bacterium]
MVSAKKHNLEQMVADVVQDYERRVSRIQNFVQTKKATAARQKDAKDLKRIKEEMQTLQKT